MLRKKILKILSVLVAIIIAFSCFILPCSADKYISGIQNLGNIKLSRVSISVEWYDENGKYNFKNLDNGLSPVGFNGDGSLKLNCDFGNTALSVVPSNVHLRFILRWYGSEDNIYFDFPDYLVPDYDIDSSTVPGMGAMRCTCSTEASYENNVFHVLSGSNCTNFCSPHHIECFFVTQISFSEFDLNISLTDPTIVPPMVSFFNELGQFFGFSMNNLSSSFNNVVTQTPLLILFFAFSIVSFGFVLFYRFIKG